MIGDKQRTLHFNWTDRKKFSPFDYMKQSNELNDLLNEPILFYLLFSEGYNMSK
jgi:hypothetical protein